MVQYHALLVLHKIKKHDKKVGVLLSVGGGCLKC